MATATRLGQTGLQGWREKVADGIAEPVARRAPLDSEQVRALLGAIFFVLSVLQRRQDNRSRDPRDAAELSGVTRRSLPGLWGWGSGLLTVAR